MAGAEIRSDGRSRRRRLIVVCVGAAFLMLITVVSGVLLSGGDSSGMPLPRVPSGTSTVPAADPCFALGGDPRFPAFGRLSLQS